MDKKDNQEDALDNPPAEPSLNSLEQLSEGTDKEQAEAAAAADGSTPSGVKPPKPKKKGFKRLLAFFNVYLVGAILLFLVGGAVFAVYYLNAKKTPPTPELTVEDLSEDALNDIASEGAASIGSSDLLLNVKSNAVFAGQILAQSDVNIAGNLRLGQALSVPNITVSGTSNLGTAQVNQLAVANSMVVAGDVTIQRGINVAGAATFSGAVTAGRITTSSLTLSGTGALELNNHIIVNGPTPGRNTGGAVGNGGSASVSGSDTAGKVNINTGQGTSAGCFITVNFVQRYNSPPNVIVSPSSAGAGRTNFYATSTNTSFSVCTADPAPTGATLDFNYFVVE
jgi:cytoskeletal protein CcmA (bactofilin family)